VEPSARSVEHVKPANLFNGGNDASLVLRGLCDLWRHDFSSMDMSLLSGSGCCLKFSSTARIASGFDGAVISICKRLPFLSMVMM
jgi:hypothetical protein